MKRIFGKFIDRVALTSSIIGLFWLMGIAIERGTSIAIATETIEQSDRLTTEASIAATSKSSLHSFPDVKDEQKYQSILKSLSNRDLIANSQGELIQQIAQKFIGAEYQAGLLDKSPQETLIISLQQFDCMLFLETVLAIASNITQKNFGYQDERLLQSFALFF